MVHITWPQYFSVLFFFFFFIIIFFFFFNDTATTEIYTLSLHDALPIYSGEMIEKLRELNIIDADEAQSLKKKIAPPDVNEKIKKYSSLVNDLRNR